MNGPVNGLRRNLGNLSRLSAAETRSILAENPNGAKGGGGGGSGYGGGGRGQSGASGKGGSGIVIVRYVTGDSNPNPDSDGDGMSDADEAIAGTNPNDSSSCLLLYATTSVAGAFVWCGMRDGRNSDSGPVSRGPDMEIRPTVGA